MKPKFPLLFALLVPALGFPAAAVDRSTEAAPGMYPTALVLAKGVLQVRPFVNYMSLDLGEAMGLDVNSSSVKGVGEYLEEGALLQFGLAKGLEAAFRCSLSEFSYGSKEAEVTTQDLRLKRAFNFGPEAWRFSAEANWQAHRTNKLKNQGVELAMSNVLHDYGYGLRLLSTRSCGRVLDLHLGAGLHLYPEDGDNGQKVMELFAGLTAFWAGRWQADLSYQYFRADRDSPVYSDTSASANNCLGLGLMTHLNDSWAVSLRAQWRDNLFYGVWPFLDREVRRLDFSDYGYIGLGVNYRFGYGGL